MFGLTVGHQCACNAMFAIYWSFIRKPSCRTPIDFHIIIKNDRIYNSLNESSFLSADYLPTEIKMLQYILDLEMEKENLHDGLASPGEPFLRNIFAMSNETSGCLLFIYNLFPLLQGNFFFQLHLIKTYFAKSSATLNYFQLESLYFKLSSQFHFRQPIISTNIF